MGKACIKKLFIKNSNLNLLHFMQAISQGRDDAGKSVLPTPSPSLSVILWCPLLAETSIKPVGKDGKWFADKAE